MIGELKGKPGKIAYGFGNLGMSLTFHMIGVFLMYFYIEKVGLDPVLVGLGFLFSYGLWNAINDPISGYISDRTRTRWGRRIPFVMFFTPLMVLFFILIWSPPVGGVRLPSPHDLWIFLYFILFVGMFELMYTFVCVGWNSLFPEMFGELKERTEVSAYRQVAATFGTVMGFAAVPLIVASLTEKFGTFGGWTLTGAVVGCIAGAAFWISLLGSRERKKFSMAGTPPVKTAFKVTLTNRSFVPAAFCVLMVSWMWSLIAAVCPFFVTRVLGGTVGDVALLFGPYLLTMILFYPLWRKICIRLGTKKTLTISTSLLVLLILPLVLAADTLLEAMVVMFFCGFANSGVTLTREILIPDVIDEDQIKTGFRREGIYMGVGTFVDRFALGLAGVSLPLILAFDVVGIRTISAAILVVALFVFLISMKYYPLTAEKVTEIRKKLGKAPKGS